METQPGWKELVILSLMWRTPITGYEIKRLIGLAEAVPSWAAITHSDVYHTLERLESRGWAAKGKRQERRATPFHLTEEGLRRLAEAIRYWLSSADHANFMEFSVALKFMDILDHEEICAALWRRRKGLLDVEAWVKKRLAATDWPAPFEPNPEADETVLAFARTQIEWTDTLLERLGCPKA